MAFDRREAGERHQRLRGGLEQGRQQVPETPTEALDGRHVEEVPAVFESAVEPLRGLAQRQGQVKLGVGVLGQGQELELEPGQRRRPRHVLQDEEHLEER